MLHRLSALGILGFWLGMNYLLWREEFAADRAGGSAIPAGLVWRKMLAAPDDSSLAVMHRGERIGFVRWSANIGEARAKGKIANEDEIPEGMIQKVEGFKLEVDGSLLIQNWITNRLRFTLHSAFGANHQWNNLDFRVWLRPLQWQLKASGATQIVRLKQSDDLGGNGDAWEHVWSFDDLRNPGKIATDLLGPAARSILPLMNAPGGPLSRLGFVLDPSATNLQSIARTGPSAPEFSGLSLLQSWEARNDWLKVGRTRIRVHRLTPKYLSDSGIAVIVSRVGEILRADFPGGIVLLNDALFVP